MRRWDGITDSMDMSLSELREMVMDRKAQHGTVHRVAKSQRLSNSEVTRREVEMVSLRLTCGGTSMPSFEIQIVFGQYWVSTDKKKNTQPEKTSEDLSPEGILSESSEGLL